MSNVVNLTANTLRRIIAEEREKLVLEAKKAKGAKNPKANVKSDPAVTKHQGPPDQPKVGGKKGKSMKAPANKKAAKAMSLDEREVEADEMADTLAKKVKSLAEMKLMEQRLRSQLRLVMERKNGIEQDIAELL
jgi:hypothetical protein